MFFGNTNKPWVVLAIVFMLMIALIPLFLSSPRNYPPSFELIKPEDIDKDFQQLPEEYLKGKEVVRVGVYILSVGNLDTRTGTYAMDLFLNLICETPPCDPTQFDIMNTPSRPIIEDQTDADILPLKQEYYYRIRANLQTNLDLKKFPFDEHTLIIELEDKNKENNEYVLIPDPELSGIDSQVYVSGWSLRPYISGVEQAHVYPVYDDETYSRVRFAIRIYHPWSSSFMKGLFAAIVIVGVGMLSFLMNETEARDRISLTSGTLASAIFYHMTLTASVPPVGYLTYADRFMILQYIFITASLGVAVSLFLLQRRDGNQTTDKTRSILIHRTTRWIIPTLWIITMVLLHVTTIGF